MENGEETEGMDKDGIADLLVGGLLLYMMKYLKRTSYPVEGHLASE
jgi:hypothetical protein